MSQYPAEESTLPYSGRLLLDPRFDFDLAAEVSSRLDGLVAIGGKITPETLIKGYSIGCFPWSSEGQAILWYCLLPRMYLDLRRGPKFRRSLLKILRHKSYTVTKDACFEETLKLCGSIPRPGQIGTWLRRDLVDALIELHRMGPAHSFECFDPKGLLMGGLYGVAVGRLFVGESMFALEPNGSKIAFSHAALALSALGFVGIDCQQETPLLASFGAEPISPTAFKRVLPTLDRFGMPAAMLLSSKTETLAEQ